MNSRVLGKGCIDIMVKKLNLHEAQKAPYLSKEDFLFKLQTTFDEPYVNLLDEGELR